MYESFFGFVNRPFLASPSLDRYFPTAAMEQAVQTATRAIARAEGPVALFGGTGLGKTICCMRIAEHFRRSFEVVMLASSPLVTRRALLQSLLFELRMPYRDLNEGELRLTLMNRLQPSPENPSDGLLLIVDEGQTLSLKLLDEIRLLTNVQRNGLPRVRLVLCGNMKLEENLCHPQMDSLNQRLAARCYLTPLSRQETANYVIHKIELCGVNHARVITHEALDALHRGSDGIPRLIDQLADQAMLIAAQERVCPVTADIVGKAWGMLQQLPNPWSEPESIKSTPKSIEIVSTQPAAIAEEGRFDYELIAPKEIEKVAPSSKMPKSAVEPLQRVDLPAAKQSIIEFGSLDECDECNTDTFAAYSTSHMIGNWGADEDETLGLKEEAQERGNARSRTSSEASQSKKNSLVDTTDPFGSDFDEEFNMPVQSFGGYQAYSGVAYGNLNHDMESFPSDPSSNRMETAEAEYFLESPVTPPFTPIRVMEFEQQVEEEMRELVSELNLSAMAFDPTQIIIELEPSQLNNSSEELPQFETPSYPPQQAYEEMRDEWNDGFVFAESTRSAMSDDRDMLVILEDTEEAVATAQMEETAESSRPVLHPYAKLFSNLRKV